MTRFFLIVILFLSVNLSAQVNFNEYSFLKSSGTIPEDFLQNFEKKYLSQKSKLNQKQKNLLGAKNANFLIYNSYQIESLLKSGIVTFNDPISAYASNILDVLLKDHTDLRKKIRVYTIKSTQANAFITSDGIIFISIGLMAQLQNEAQLAYVLSHELIHFTDNHHIHEYLRKQDFIENYSKSRTNEAKIKSIFNYSKENEMNADSKGFKNYYLESGYSLAEIEPLFDILLYSYLPIDEVKFNLSFFEGESYIFPEEYALKEYNEITAIENYDDTNSTHPNILKRRSALLSLIAGYKNANKKKFIVSEKDFNNAKKTSRYELSLLFRLYNDFEKAIYNSYILLKEDPENKFLKTNIAESLYALAYHKNHGKYSKAHIRHKKIEGYSQQVNFLFSKLKKTELNLLSLRYAWLLKTKYPEDKNINQITDSIIKESTINSKINLSELTTETFVKIDSVDYEKLTKTEKIKYNKKLTDQGVKYYYNSLVGLENINEIFKKSHEFSAIENEPKEIETKTKKKKPSRSLEIDKLILLPPYFEVKKNNLSESGMSLYKQKLNEFTSSFQKSANKLNISIDKYNINDINKNDVEKFNDYALLSMWTYEMTVNASGLINGTEKYIKKKFNKNEKQYYVNTGIGFSNDKPYYFLILYNTNTGKVAYSYKNYLEKLKRDYLTSKIYYSLYRISNNK